MNFEEILDEAIALTPLPHFFVMECKPGLPPLLGGDRV